MKEKILLGVLLISLVVVSRWLPHAPNFVPVGAVALMVGAYANRRLWIVLPLAALFVSDVVIGLYDWRLMFAVYASYGLIGYVGSLVRQQVNVISVVAASLAASLLFFVITNAAVWGFSAWYTKDLQGLLYCYELALPFFRNTLFSDLIYSTVLFSGVEFAVRSRLFYALSGIKLKNWL